MFIELAQLSIGNLLRARARLIITAGGVVVGTTAVIMLIALTIGLQTAAEAGLGSSTQLTQIDVYPSWSPDGSDTPQLDIASVQKFWEIEGVGAVVPTVYLYSEVWAGDYVGYPQVIGIDSRLLPYLGLTPSLGELAIGDGKVIVGQYAGEYFNDPNYTGDEWQPISVDLTTSFPILKLYQYSGEVPQEREVRLDVVGQFAEGTYYDYGIIMALEDAVAYKLWTEGKDELDPETFRYDQVTVFASSRETTSQVGRAIRDLGYSTGGMSEYVDQLNSFFRTMRLMLGGVGGVALLVAAFGVANTMTMSILERTKEIGLMKAIGATDQDVLSIFLIEASLVGFIGGLAGVLLSLFLQNVINRAVENIPTDSGASFLPIDTSQINGNLIIIPTELWLFAIVLSTIVGLAAGLFPSLRAARMAPVIALKQE